MTGLISNTKKLAVLLVSATLYILAAFLVLYTLLVIVTFYGPTSMKWELVFMNRLHNPFANFSDIPLDEATNFYLSGDEGRIGSWYAKRNPTDTRTSEAYALYLHGNGGDRTHSHRVECMKVLTNLGYNVLAIDYRGFGDSDGWPSEVGVVDDAKVAYSWLLKEARGTPIYIFGHSLGTAIGIQVAAWLNSQHMHLDGIFLLAPFTSIYQSIPHSPLAKPIKPFFEFFRGNIEDCRDMFRSDEYIKHISSPIYIFHDISDEVLDIFLGRALYTIAETTPGVNAKFYELDENLSHDFVHRSKVFKEKATPSMNTI